MIEALIIFCTSLCSKSSGDFAADSIFAGHPNYFGEYYVTLQNSVALILDSMNVLIILVFSNEIKYSTVKTVYWLLVVQDWSSHATWHNYHTTITA